MLTASDTKARDITLSIWFRRINTAILTIVLLIFTLLVIGPFIWMILMSLRTTGEILLNPYGLPTIVPLAELHQIIIRSVD